MIASDLHGFASIVGNNDDDFPITAQDMVDLAVKTDFHDYYDSKGCLQFLRGLERWSRFQHNPEDIHHFVISAKDVYDFTKKDVLNFVMTKENLSWFFRDQRNHDFAMTRENIFDSVVTGEDVLDFALTRECYYERCSRFHRNIVEIMYNIV